MLLIAIARLPLLQQQQKRCLTRGFRTLQMVSLLQLNFLPPTLRLTMCPLAIVWRCVTSA